MRASHWQTESRLLDNVIVVAIGGNIGSPEAIVGRARDAVESLSELWGLAQLSDFYRSAALGAVTEQADFINAVAAWRPESEVSPEVALFDLQALELRHGRERGIAGGPRTLDLDLLLHGEETRCHEGLRLPHPRMHTRAFVLRPLLDLFEDSLCWSGHKTLGSLLAETEGQQCEGLEL